MLHRWHRKILTGRTDLKNPGGYREHGELTNFATACPSGRIQPLYDSYATAAPLPTEEDDMVIFVKPEGRPEVFELLSGRHVTAPAEFTALKDATMDFFDTLTNADVGDGRLRPGGALPFNTYGGGLSCTHPGMLGIFTTVEAVRQLRGECGDWQVEGATIGLAHGNGGMFAHESTALLGTAAAL